MKSPQKSRFGKLVAYLLDPQGKNTRVGEVSITNCVSSDTAWAVREITATQGLNARAISSLSQPTASDAPRRITRMNRNAPAFRRLRSSATKEQLREYFEVRFRTEKYGVPYFLAESEAKQSGPRKEAVGARARNAVEDLNGGNRREALGGGRLSRRRHSCTEGRPWVRNGSGVSQTRYWSDFKRTWVRLGERGRRDRLGARRGRKSFLPDLDRNLKWRSSEGASARWSDGSPHQILAFWTSPSARTTTAFEIGFFSYFANLQNSVPNCINKLPLLSRLRGATSTRHSTTLGWTSSRTQTQIFVDCADY